MQVIELLKKGQEIIAQASDTPRLDCEVILSSLIGCKRIDLYFNDNELDSKLIELFLEKAEQAGNGMPVQYIINNKEFMGLDFYVDNTVLIPRNDTEILCEYVIDYLKTEKIEYPRVLDMCTGSGAIAVSIAYFIKTSSVLAVDIDSAALNTAAINSERHGVKDRITYLESDIFKLVENEDKYNIIVSNPPYIPNKNILTLDRRVKDFEPTIALDGGSDGLDFYRKIISGAPDYLCLDGIIVVEVGYNQAEEVVDLFLQSKRFCDVETINDLAGYKRVVKAKVK